MNNKALTIRPAHWKMRSALCSLCLSVGILPGCALYVKTMDGDLIRTTSSEFNDYAAQVFRLHNKVTTDLAYALDEIEFSNSEDSAFQELINADDRMLNACSAVDEVAIARRDGEKVSLKQLNTAARFIPDCEKATLEANKLIYEIESD
jgi:hypothetical protein